MHFFRFHIPHYFSKHPSRELTELYWSVGIMDFAGSAVALFEPIFLWTLGYGFVQILLFYAAVYLGYALLIPLGARVAARFGFEHTIFYSQFAFIAYYLCLFGLDRAPWLVVVAPIIFAIQKSLYWPAYHADFMLFSGREQRGREVSGVLAVSAIATVLGPIAGGLLLKFFGFHTLFITVAVLFLTSSLPLLRLKEVHDPTPFSYKNYWKLLWKPSHRRSALAYFGYAEELIAMVLWPVFIYLTVQEFSSLGLLVGLATLVTTLIGLMIGKASDRLPKPTLLAIGAVGSSVIWLVRVLIFFTPFRVLLLDTGGRTAKNIVTVPLVSMTYEHGVREEPLAIAVFFEQALAIGKFVIALVLVGLVQLGGNPWQIAFITAAVMSLLYGLVKAPSPLPVGQSGPASPAERPASDATASLTR